MPQYTDQDPAEKMKHHHEQHRRACSTHGREIVAAGELFGKPLHDVLTRSFEDLAEHAGERDYWAERLIDELTDQIDKGRTRFGEMSRELNDRTAELDQQAATIRTLFVEFDRRAARSGKPLPAWLEQLRPADPDTEAPF